jgi:putative endonuclease
MNAEGEKFERRAAQWLRERGMRLLARNFRTKLGEIDLVALDDGCLVFVEVRVRHNTRFAGAAASVGRDKQRRLQRTALLFLQQRPDLANFPCRFDVIAFEPRQFAPGTALRWIRAAFTT